MSGIARAAEGRRFLLWVTILAVLTLTAAPCLAQPDEGGGRGRGFRGDRRPGGMGGRMGRPGGMGGRMGGMGGFNELFQPDFQRRDLRVFIDELLLHEDQGTIVQVLLLDYEAAFAEAAEAARDRFAELRPRPEDTPENAEQRQALRERFRDVRREIDELRRNAPQGQESDPAVFEEIRAKIEPLVEQMRDLRPQMPQGVELERIVDEMTAAANQWNRQREAMKRRFLDDVQIILSDGQLELWPALDRTLRRTKTLPRGRLSGESVDLLFVLTRINATQRELNVLDEVLQAYVLELDLALKARNEYLDGQRIEAMQAMIVRDTDRAMTLIAPEANLRISVRAVNERYASMIEAQLAENISPKRSEEFRDIWRQEAFPRIFQPTRTERAFEVAVEFEDLEENVLIAILALQESFLADLDVKNEQLLQATRKQEPREIEQRVQRRMDRTEGGPPGGRRAQRGEEEEDPVEALFRERIETELRYRQQLEALLTEEQIERLPAPPRMRGRRGGRGGPGGDAPFGGGRGGRGGEEFRQRMLERFDRDGDGEISDEEREAARREFIQRFDRDGDGELSDEERRAAFEERRRQRETGNDGT